MENKIIKITDELGNEREAEVVLSFETEGKNYIIYTFNEKDSNNSIILYSSIIKEENDEVIFEKMPEEDWKMIKELMNKVVKDWKE